MMGEEEKIKNEKKINEHKLLFSVEDIDCNIALEIQNLLW